MQEVIVEYKGRIARGYVLNETPDGAEFLIASESLGPIDPPTSEDAMTGLFGIADIYISEPSVGVVKIKDCRVQDIKNIELHEHSPKQKMVLLKGEKVSPSVLELMNLRIHLNK